MAEPDPKIEGLPIQNTANSKSWPDTEDVLVHGIHGNGEGDRPNATTNVKKLPTKEIFDKHPSTYLNMAVKQNNVELMDFLMGYLKSVGIGASLPETDRLTEINSYISEALCEAAAKGHLEMVDCLLKWNIDVNAFSNGQSALHYAAAAGHTDVVQRLVNSKANTDLLNSERLAPLQVAHRFANVIAILLEANPKPDINRVTLMGTVLHLAIRSNSSQVVKLLLRSGANPNQKTGGKSYIYPLSFAVMTGHADLARMLLEAGANVDARDEHGTAALHRALLLDEATKNDQCVRVLLEYRPLLDIQDKDGDTPLNYLVTETPVSSIRLMINAGANPEIPNLKGQRPIYRAFLKKNFNVAEYLLHEKVEINFGTTTFGAPIHVACYACTLDFVELLITHGADVELPDTYEFNKTPLQAALENIWDFEPQKQIVSRLLNAGVDVNKAGGQYGYAIIAAFLMSSLDIIKLLLAHNADTNVADGSGRNPAHVAALRTADHVELLKDSPELFSQQDILGRNALHYAVGSGRLDVVKKVSQIQNINVNAKDKSGWTPLMWAARCRRVVTDGHFGNRTGDDHKEIISYLVNDCGANIWVIGDGWDTKWSSLKLARFHGASQDIQSFLAPPCSNTSSHSSDPLWNEKLHEFEEAQRVERTFCNLCLYELRGDYYKCLDCKEYRLCFRCYPYQESAHPGHRLEDYSDGRIEKRTFVV